MGKTKIKDQKTEDVKQVAQTKFSSKRKIVNGILNIEATFNNTKVTFCDEKGNALFSSSSGALGFKGAKKGTPYAASKVGDLIGGKAKSIGVQDSEVIVRGVGSGRESVIRSFMSHDIQITSIKDATPIPHNGPKKKKPRRV